MAIVPATFGGGGRDESVSGRNISYRGAQLKGERPVIVTSSWIFEEEGRWAPNLRESLVKGLLTGIKNRGECETFCQVKFS